MQLGRWIDGPATITHTHRGTTIRYQWTAGKYTPTEITVANPHGVTSTDLRVIKPGQALHAAVRPHLKLDGHPAPSGPAHIPTPDRFGTQTRPTPDLHLAYVGQVYELAVALGLPPYRHLARLLDSSEVTAYNWCKKARAAGHITINGAQVNTDPQNGEGAPNTPPPPPP